MTPEQNEVVEVMSEKIFTYCRVGGDSHAAAVAAFQVVSKSRRVRALLNDEQLNRLHEEARLRTYEMKNITLPAEVVDALLNDAFALEIDVERAKREGGGE